MFVLAELAINKLNQTHLERDQKMAAIQNKKRGKAQNRKKSPILPMNDSNFFRKSHGYWEYPDPVIPLMAMLTSKAQRNALQKAIDSLPTEDLYYSLFAGDEDLSNIPEKIRKQIAEVIKKDELSERRFDEVIIASFEGLLGTGLVINLYARRRGKMIVYRYIDDTGNQDEWLLDHYLSVEEVAEYLGVDLDYVDDLAIEKVPIIIEKKLKDIRDIEAIREEIISWHREDNIYDSDFYPLDDYCMGKYADAVVEPVSAAAYHLRYGDFRHYVDDIMDEQYYDFIEFWDLTIKQRMADGTVERVPYQATIKWYNNKYFEGSFVNQQSNLSFKVLSGCASNGPFNMGAITFDVSAADGSTRHFHGDIIDEWSIFGHCSEKDEKHSRDIQTRWSAFRNEKICFEDNDYEDDDYEDDTELNPMEVSCPVCGQRELSCSHILADFDCTFPGEGKYGIGLMGGALRDVDMIGELFETIAHGYARARYKGKKAKLPIGPKDAAFQEYVREIKKVRLKAKAYNSEENYCYDFHTNIENYARLVREALLELLDDFSVYRKFAAVEIPTMSSTVLLWYCSDPGAAVTKLKDMLVRILSDFKRENGLT